MSRTIYHHWASKLALSLFSFIVAVYVADLILMFYFPGVVTRESDLESRAKIARKQGLSFDSRIRLDVIKDLRKKGVDVYLWAGACHLISKRAPKNIRVLPLAGISNVQTLLGNETGTYVIYKSDRYGFRNPDESWTAPNVDIVLVGDSYAHGAEVPSDEDIGGSLRKMGYSVINLGIAGNGPLMELASITEYARKVRPKNVFWLYFEGNDLQDLKTEKASKNLTKYLDNSYSQNLVFRQTEIDRLLKESIRNREQSETLRLEQGSAKRLFKLLDLKGHLARLTYDPECYDEIDPIFEQVLRRTKDEISSWGGRLYFVYLPKYKRYYSSKASESDLCNKRLIFFMVRNLQISLVDIDAAFSKQPDPLSLFPFRMDGHYNAQGYSLVANCLQAALSR